MLTRRAYRWTTLLYAAGVVYGSLVPFDFQPLPMADMLNRFVAICSTPEPVVSRSDLAANVLLLVPLGFLAMGALLGEPGRRGWLAILPVVLMCTAFGASVEALQLVFPPRTCSRNDILAQAVGSLLGAAWWVIWSTSLAQAAEKVLEGFGGDRRFTRYLLAYVVFIIVLETAPFDFTLSPVELVHKWREGRIGVVPFLAYFDPTRRMVAKTLTNLVLFLPLGLLLGAAGHRGRRALVLGLLTAAAVEVLQAFVISRNFEPTDIVVGMTAVWLGWRLITVKMRLAGAAAQWLCGALLVTWILVAAMLFWAPFQFTAAGAVERWHALSLVPLADYAEKHYLIAFDEMAHTALLFALLGLLLATSPSITVPAWACFAVGGLVAGAFEAGQLFLPERFASVSEVVLGGVGCALGASISTRMPGARYASTRTGTSHIMYEYKPTSAPATPRL